MKRVLLVSLVFALLGSACVAAGLPDEIGNEQGLVTIYKSPT